MIRLTALLLLLLLSGCAVLTGAAGSIVGAVVTSIGEGMLSEIGSKAVDAVEPDVEAELDKIAGKYRGASP